MGWYVVTEFVGIVGQPTVVRLVPRLRPARTSRSRASLSCPWKEAWTKSATFYPAAEAAAPDQSTRPCSDAANQSDPSTHGFRDCNPWQGGGASVSILILIAAPKKGVGNYAQDRYAAALGGLNTLLSMNFCNER